MFWGEVKHGNVLGEVNPVHHEPYYYENSRLN
jgi:hypothetical protein